MTEPERPIALCYRAMRSLLLGVLLVAGCQANENKAAPSSQVQPPPVSTPAPVSEPAPTKPAPANPPAAAVPPLPSPLPGKRIDLTGAIGSAWRAAIGDFNGDKKREIVVVDSKQMRVIDASGNQIASAPVTSGIQVLVAADVDGDGKSEILAGWGLTRDFKDAKARITLHHVQGKQIVEQLIAEPATTRQDVTAIVPVEKGALLVAYYDGKYTVTSAMAKQTGRTWKLDTIASIRMATSYARGDVDGDGKPDLVVGRIYGDDKGVDGDAFVLAPDGSRAKVPTTRGLRSLAIVGSDIFLGDGWHQNYGQNARGLLTRAWHDKDGYHAELVEDTAGQYGLERILPAKIDGKQVLVTQGSHYVRVFAKNGAQWKGLTIAGPSRDIAVGDLDAAPGDEVLIVGDKSELVDLHGALFQ